MTEQPIIQSLLDTDFYKFTMGQLVFNRFKDVPVKFGFKNRTKGVNLVEFPQIDHLKVRSPE